MQKKQKDVLISATFYTVPGNPASFLRRIGSYLIDWLVLLLFASIFQIIVFGRFDKVDKNFLTYSLICYAGYIVYFIWMHARYRQTVGKFLVKTEIVCRHDFPLKIILKRAFICSIPAIPGVVYFIVFDESWPFFNFGCLVHIISYAFMFLNKENKTLHDLISDTSVNMKEKICMQ